MLSWYTKDIVDIYFMLICTMNSLYTYIYIMAYSRHFSVAPISRQLDKFFHHLLKLVSNESDFFAVTSKPLLNLYSLLIKGLRDLFDEVKNGKTVKLISHLSLVRRSRKTGDYLRIPFSRLVAMLMFSENVSVPNLK